MLQLNRVTQYLATGLFGKRLRYIQIPNLESSEVGQKNSNKKYRKTPLLVPGIGHFSNANYFYLDIDLPHFKNGFASGPNEKCKTVLILVTVVFVKM